MHEILGEAQNQTALLVSSEAPQSARRLFQSLHGKLPRGELFQDVFDALELLARHERLAQLLQVYWRTVFRMKVAHFVAGQHVQRNLIPLQAQNEFIEKLSARIGVGPAGGGIEKSAGIGRIVQIIAKLGFVLLVQKLALQFGGLDLRGQQVELLLNEGAPAVEIGETCPECGDIFAAQHAREDIVTAVQSP